MVAKQCTWSSRIRQDFLRIHKGFLFFAAATVAVLTFRFNSPGFSVIQTIHCHFFHSLLPPARFRLSPASCSRVNWSFSNPKSWFRVWILYERYPEPYFRYYCPKTSILPYDLLGYFYNKPSQIRSSAARNLHLKGIITHALYEYAAGILLILPCL